MLCNCSIARAQAHIADLTFSEVFENTVSAVAVRIAMLKSLFACDDNYQRVLRRGYDSSLLLPAKARMNVEPPIVNSANLKSPSHLPSPILRHCTVLSLWAGGANALDEHASRAASASPILPHHEETRWQSGSMPRSPGTARSRPTHRHSSSSLSNSMGRQRR